MYSVDCGLWCWDVTTLTASDEAPSQRRGWRVLLSFSFKVRMRQARVTLPWKFLRGVCAPNRREEVCQNCVLSLGRFFLHFYIFL